MMQRSEDLVVHRRAAMTILARSVAASIGREVAAAGCEAEFFDLRGPEVGLAAATARCLTSARPL
jgi:alpha-D-ribose 1-methylphosphonate 5-triphosphate synthase subunit PhnG